MNARVSTLPGDRYGRLVIIREIQLLKGRWFLLRCDCGNEVTVVRNHLRSGRTQSCGCLRNDRVREPAATQINVYPFTGRAARTPRITVAPSHGTDD